jgi:hypothetical protein
MKHRIGAALAVAAMFTGATLPSAAIADDQPPAASRSTTEQLQQDLEARAQKDAEVMASDAMTAASDLELSLDIERVSPRALVLVSDI